MSRTKRQMEILQELFIGKVASYVITPDMLRAKELEALEQEARKMVELENREAAI